MDLQSDQTDYFSELIILSFPEIFIGSYQLVALKLIEQGKITFDTPVAYYIPEFRNPIIVDITDTDSTQKTSFKPAQTVVTLKLLLSFTSSLFYPTGRVAPSSLKKGYSLKEMHLSEDPISEFSRIVIVRFIVIIITGIRINNTILLGRASWFTPEI